MTKKHKWKQEPSCLDSAYEREAVEQGLVEVPVFPENDLQTQYVGYIIVEEKEE